MNPEVRSQKSEASNGKAVGVLVALCVGVALLGGCAVGPNYQRPALDTPSAFRASVSDTNDLAATESLANVGWWQVMNDPQLQAYIAEALTNSAAFIQAIGFPGTKRYVISVARRFDHYRPIFLKE